jgi:ZIP family zinc transporter
MPNILLVSTIAGLATGLGGLIANLFKKPSISLVAFLLGFAAGVMIAVTGFDLIPSAFSLGGLGKTVLGVLCGVVFLWVLDRLIPHQHPDGGCGETHLPEKWKKTGVFIAVGIALHNLPEGLAIGAGYFAAESLGVMIAMAITMHNIPEGMATALPLQLGGVSPWKIVVITSLAGFFTPIGTYIGMLLYGISGGLIGFFLAFAGGAMLYIAADELIPSCNRYHKRFGNLGILVGFGITLLASLI